ncbi:TPA: hypothetical protein IAV99_001916 [Salmonella enterica subsp. enterica serovar Albany]|nr:hypothetical protein [Salmonella enterica]HAM2364700.1 hypothetical protein [Salmonella enterica subsp. enterica serovar Albany]
MADIRLIGDVFPAPAGINRGLRELVLNPACVPRASGDKPELRELILNLASCSPRQRG